MIIDDEDYAHEVDRQRRTDAEWIDAEDVQMNQKQEVESEHLQTHAGD